MTRTGGPKSPRAPATPAAAKPKPRRPRRAAPAPPPQPTAQRWAKETGPKTCQKCGGQLLPADWIWQKYGLCVGWRCAGCKERVLARSLPFKGLRRRPLDPDEIACYQKSAPRADERPPDSRPRIPPATRR